MKDNSLSSPKTGVSVILCLSTDFLHSEYFSKVKDSELKLQRLSYFLHFRHLALECQTSLDQSAQTLYESVDIENLKKSRSRSRSRLDLDLNLESKSKV